ncbi:MAG TPA: hypothetical protein VFE53_22625 [Mucilaginibacter sp.]|jgi:hypothetical protein|nr:hypothetical protein [Mucilaginibacter sp.]
MKYLKPALITILGIFLFISRNYSQTKHHKSIVSTKIVVLSFKHNDSSYLEDHTDTLNIPVVSDKYLGLKKALAFENIGDADGLQDAIDNFAACGCGITGMSYEVVFESKDILSIEIFIDAEGAHPSSNTKRLTLNVHTGKAYTLDREINTAGLKWIYSSYRKVMKQRIAEDFESRKGEEDENVRADLIESIDSLTSLEMLKDYLFTKSGIMFSTEGILPHVVQNLEPDREWFVPYSRLRKYKTPHAIIVK